MKMEQALSHLVTLSPFHLAIFQGSRPQRNKDCNRLTLDDAPTRLRTTEYGCIVTIYPIARFGIGQLAQPLLTDELRKKLTSWPVCWL
jgi:hypothetical protein